MFSRSLKVVSRSTRLTQSGAVPRFEVAALARCLSVSAVAREELGKTPLYDYHVSQKAKMVPFAGFSMPLQYGDVGQVTAHNHVRTSAGLFDVSHMLQHRFTGGSSQAFLMSLTPSSLHSLKPYTSTLSVLLNEHGGIIDDTIITKQANDDTWYVVTNAGRIKEDVAHISAKLEAWNAKSENQVDGQKVQWEKMEGRGLLALQGPKSAEVLQSITKGVQLDEMNFGQAAWAQVGKEGVECHIARGGYTGEDGFEVSIPAEATQSITEQLIALPNGVVQLIGLGARDSLRLEAGMCLYGHDLDESISPVEAGLTWVIGKDRRSADSPNPFPGQSRILAEIANGPKKRRVGFEIKGSPAREGCKVFSKDGSEQIGVITSGIPSPTLNTNIAMGYVTNGQHKKGTPVMIEVRKKMREATVRTMPFVPSKYYKGKGALSAPA